MGFFDTVGGQDLKKLYGAGVGAAKDLGSYMLDNTFYGTGRDMDIVKGLGQYLMSPAPKSQIEEIKKFREQEDDIVNMMGGMPEYTGLPPALGSYEARQMSPGEFKSRFGSPSFGQDSGLAIGDDSANIQNEIQRIKDGKEAEDFRSKEAQIIKEQGGVTNKDKGLIRSGENIKNMDDAFTGGMSAYMEALGGQLDDQKKKGQKPSKSNKELLEYYKKEFADATGISIDGKPDKRDALMAFGLALMQNKAGKKFNVGKMLAATGEAGEKAMPFLTKAKNQAKAERVAAGKYALQQIESDENAESAIQASTIAFKREIALKNLDAFEEAKKEGLGKLENPYNASIKIGGTDYNVRKAFDPKTGRQFFTNGAGDAAKLGGAYRKNFEGLQAINELKEIDSILQEVSQGAGGFTGKILFDRAGGLLSAMGITSADQLFKEAVEIDPSLKGVSLESSAQKIRQSLLLRFKRFLTSETGNGISNVDWEVIKAALGEYNPLKNPNEARAALNTIQGFFEGSIKELEDYVEVMSNEKNYQTYGLEDNYLYNETMKSFQNTLGDIGKITASSSPDGTVTYDVS